MNEEVKRKMRIRGGGKDEMRWECDEYEVEVEVEMVEVEAKMR